MPIVQAPIAQRESQDIPYKFPHYSGFCRIRDQQLGHLREQSYIIPLVTHFRLVQSTPLAQGGYL